MKPALGKKYFLLIDEQQKIESPRCLVAGAVMSLGSNGDYVIDLNIYFSESIKNQVFKVVALMKGIEVLNLDVKTHGI